MSLRFWHRLRRRHLPSSPRRGPFQHFVKNQDGGVILWIGLFLGTLAAGALVIDLSMLYVAKHRAQVVSDAAVLAAAATSEPIRDNQPSNGAVAAAAEVARINGYDTAQVVTEVAPSPRDGSPALHTTIRNPVRLNFSFLSPTGYGAVATESWAAAQSKSALCTQAVSGSISIYNNAQVTGPNCIAIAKTYFNIYNSATTVLSDAKQGNASGGTTSQTGPTGIIGGLQKGVALPADAYDNAFEKDTRIKTLRATLENMQPAWPASAKPLSPATPQGPALSYNGETATVPTGKYASLLMTDSNVSFTGPGAPDPDCTSPTTFQANWNFTGTNKLTFQSGCYVVGRDVTAQAGASVTFDVAPGAQVTFIFDAALHAYPNSTMRFGDATTILNGGTISVDTAANLTFGNGPFWLWGGSMVNAAQATLQFGNGPFYFYGGTLYNYATMTFGDGPFYFSGGSLASTSVLTFGKGPFYFDGGSVALASGANTSFGVGDVFLYGGSFSDGNKGTLEFGRGGDAVNGSGTLYLRGGSQYFLGTVIAKGMTLGIWGGSLYFYNGGDFTMTAPTATNPTLGYREVAIAVWGGSTYMERVGTPTATISGLIYNVPATISIHQDENLVMPQGNACLQIVAGVIAIYERAKVQMEPCRSFPTGFASTTGALVQ